MNRKKYVFSFLTTISLKFLIHGSFQYHFILLFRLKKPEKKPSKPSDEKIGEKIEPVSCESDEEESAPDFEYLLKLPSQPDSHFMLKSEQLKFNQKLDDNLFNYFSVDIKTLNLSLKVIPLNERHNIVEWTSEELNEMQSVAAGNEDAYRDYLVRNAVKRGNDKDKKKGEIEKPKSLKQPENDMAKTPKSNDDKELIQKWLDDILDI